MIEEKTAMQSKKIGAKVGVKTPTRQDEISSVSYGILITIALNYQL